MGDAIKSIVIEGADEEALAEAISHELPRPKSPKEVLEELEHEREERRKQAEADAAAGRKSSGFPPGEGGVALAYSYVSTRSISSCCLCTSSLR